ncbi:MAG: hypothetical protein M1830_007482, partial [Pleopsidium flavum]
LTVSDTSKRLEVEDSSDRPQPKQRSSVALKGPKLQTSTSGVGFEEFAMGDLSDLKGGDGSAKFRLDAQIQRELFVARKRSKDLGDIGGWRNIALEEVKKTETGEKEIEWV